MAAPIARTNAGCQRKRVNSKKETPHRRRPRHEASAAGASNIAVAKIKPATAGLIPLKKAFGATVLAEARILMADDQH